MAKLQHAVFIFCSSLALACAQTKVPEGSPSPTRLAPPRTPPSAPTPSLEQRQQALILGEVAPEPADALAPAPQIELFAERATVSYEELLAALRDEAERLSQEQSIIKEHRELMDAFSLDAEELPLESFSRIRLLFEATRDGGLWGLRWNITDEMPWSDKIWSQWADLKWHDASTHRERYTAIAECDELSALFALLARDIRVEGFVGLHWPTWNHVVAVWELQGKHGRKVRILVPTSQIFLTPTAGLGTQELKTNRVVFPYTRRDIEPSAQLSSELARYLIHQIRTFGSLSRQELQERRARRGGS